MPSKTRKRRKQQGKGPAWDWIKKAAKDVHGFVKDKKLISKGLNALASSGITPYSAGFSRAATVASNLGYGKRSKTRKKTKKGRGRKPGRRRKTTK